MTIDIDLDSGESSAVVERNSRRRSPTVEFGADGFAVGWAYRVGRAFRSALDIALTTRIEKAKLPDGREIRKKVQVWTEGDPPAYAFRATDCLGSRDVMDGTTELNCRLLVVTDALPDVLDGRKIQPGTVRFRLLEWESGGDDQGRYVERAVRSVSQAGFADILRTGRL